MAEVIIGNDTGRKRRLPPWMLGVCDADEPRKSGNGNMKRLLLEDQTKHHSGSNTEPITREHDKIPSEIDAAERGKSSKSTNALKRMGKARRRAEDPSSSIKSLGEAVALKKKLKKGVAGCGRITHARAAPKKQNLKNDGPNDSNLEGTSPGRSEDEIELTVEDLLSIAEEYVGAHREQQSKVPLGSEIDRSSLSIPSKAHLESPIQAAGGPPQATESIQRGTNRDEKEIPATESFSASITSSGDVARDMLDLFLGPLLRRTPSEHQDMRIAGTEEMRLVYESNNQSKSGTALKEEVPLIKKKSSLKDKVAMFLD